MINNRGEIQGFLSVEIEMVTAMVVAEASS